MSTNRVRTPTAFRPGINLQSIPTMQRPWNYGTMRLASAASHRAPYVLYRSSPKRYAMKHYAPSATRNMFTHNAWKTTVGLPLMSSVTSEYEFIKAASAQPVMHSDADAPNLSLSEKPIVVIEAEENPTTNQPNPSYEVTEKYPEGEYSITKIQPPVGFSKATSFTTPELQALIRNGAALQLASEFALPITLKQHRQITPQQFAIQKDLLNTGAEGVFIPPTALYQSDPMFLQKLQGQLIHRFPAVEFIPYTAETTGQIHLQQQPQASENHPQIVLLENEQLYNKPPATSALEQDQQRNVVQRETQGASVLNLMPHSFTLSNTTDNQVELTTTQEPQNITVELIATESQPITTTIKYVMETSTEEQNTTPIYYAQIGQSVGPIVANGFYSAINDVRAAAAVAEENNLSDKTSEKPAQGTTTTTTALVPDLQAYSLQSYDKTESPVRDELKPHLGVPFTKAEDAVNVAYTLVRAEDKQPKFTQEGTVYAGQIVEATISEDHDFNKEKASLMSRRAPIRLLTSENSNNVASTTNKVSVPKVMVVKAKIPPKTKLTFDDETGEPILRIYASYVDDISQKDAVISNLASPIKEAIIKNDMVESWKGATMNSVDKSQGVDANQVTQFGLKIRERSDDYIPLFEDYDD